MFVQEGVWLKAVVCRKGGLRGRAARWKRYPLNHRRGLLPLLCRAGLDSGITADDQNLSFSSDGVAPQHLVVDVDHSTFFLFVHEGKRFRHIRPVHASNNSLVIWVAVPSGMYYKSRGQRQPFSLEAPILYATGSRLSDCRRCLGSPTAHAQKSNQEERWGEGRASVTETREASAGILVEIFFC